MPDFLVIGAPKAGTTALHAALARPPGLYMSAVEEPQFFLTSGPPPPKCGPAYALPPPQQPWRCPGAAAAQTQDRICESLGVAPVLLTEIPRQNVTSHPEPTLGHHAVSAAQRAASAFGTLIPGLTAATLTGPLERYLQRHSRERQPLSWEQRPQLIPRFEADIGWLEQA